MIKNIVFDIGNVLIDFAWKATMEELGFDKECIDTLDRGFINNDLWDEMDRGVLSFDEVVKLATDKMPAYEKEIRLFTQILEDSQITVTRRREMGRDISGACGQLVRRSS